MRLIKICAARKILKRGSGSAISVLRQHCVEPKKSRWNEKLSRIENFYDEDQVCWVARKMEEKTQQKEVFMRS